MTATRVISALMLACALATSITGACLADTVTLAAGPHIATDQLRSAVAKPTNGQPLSKPELFASQSFRILGDGREVGRLVSGRGELPAASADANPGESCFVALVRPGKQPDTVLTIGFGDWEAESCVTVVALGLLPAAGAQTRAGIIYKATAPHESPIEPVVVTWSDTQPLQIDAAASKRASNAGATTLKAMREALR